MRLSLVPLAMSVVLIAGCGGSETTQESVTTPTPAQTTATQASPTATATSQAEEAPVLSVDGVTVTGQRDRQPKITVTPDTPPPAGLVSADVYEGDGKEITEGGAGQFNYEGVLFSDGVLFDSSWERGQPISFGLDQVIPGWQQGLIGMREGGRRLLIIPPELAYGQAALGGIPPNSTLVFVVDLNRVLE